MFFTVIWVFQCQISDYSAYHAKTAALGFNKKRGELLTAAAFYCSFTRSIQDHSKHHEHL